MHSTKVTMWDGTSVAFLLSIRVMYLAKGAQFVDWMLSVSGSSLVQFFFLLCAPLCKTEVGRERLAYVQNTGAAGTKWMTLWLPKDF